MTVEYAKVGGPPDNWKLLTVYRDGAFVPYWVEAKAGIDGWTIQYKLNDDGQPITSELVKTNGKVLIAERQR